jgi:hypothetical protein
VRARVRSLHRTIFAPPSRFCILVGMRSNDRPANRHLPPHLREVCELLARGIVRLRSRAAEKNARQAENQGERLLHFPATQRRHANPNGEGVA